MQYADKISPDEIIIGKLGKTRGLDGTLKIISLTDFENRFDDLKKIKVGEKILSVEKISHIGGEIFVKFAGVNDRESAKLLTNKFLTVNRSDAAPLADDEFYFFDIIGCEVFDGEKKIGTVKNILRTGSNDVLEISGAKEILIPALKSVVREINLPEKKIFVDMTGLEEI